MQSIRQNSWRVLERLMSKSAKDIVAYFDFDGTITKHDTFIPFLAYAVGWLNFILKLPRAFPIAIMYGLKIITNEEAKQRMLTLMVRKNSFSLLDKKARGFAHSHLTYLIKPEIYTRVEYHLEHGHKVILVSANLALYLNYWAKQHHISDVIATEIEFVNDDCTGRLATRNCYGAQKILRIEQYLAQKNIKFDYSYGYGNSKGDYELLNYVDEAYFVSGHEIEPWEKHAIKAKKQR